MQLYFYTNTQGIVCGPVTADSLQEMLDRRQLNPQCQVYIEEEQTWKPLACFITAQPRQQVSSTKHRPANIPQKYRPNNTPKSHDLLILKICIFIIGSASLIYYTFRNPKPSQSSLSSITEAISHTSNSSIAIPSPSHPQNFKLVGTIQSSTDEFGFTYIYAQIKNESGTNYQSVHASFAIRDKNGNVVSMAYGSCLNMKAGETKAFEAVAQITVFDGITLNSVFGT